MLNNIIHQPIRTKIITYLYSVNNASFREIKSLLKLTDGNMSTHMKILIKNELVSSEKFFKNDKPVTTYRITEHGKKLFLNYIAELKIIVDTMPDQFT